MADPENPSLSSRIRRAYFWTIAGSTARYLFGFIVSILLARLLSPSDYGLIGLVMVFIEVLVVFYDSGLGNSVIHFYDEKKPEEGGFFYTVAFLVGGVSTLLLVLCAPFIADFFNDQRLTAILRVMSLTMLIGSIKTISGSILAKELRFRALSAVDITSSVVGGVVAIVMAYQGFGVWSLVANLLLFVALQAIGYAWFSPVSFTGDLPWPRLKQLWRYGAPATGSGLLHKFYDSSDYVIAGKMLGATQLGYYSLAFRLAMLINDRISAVVNRVAFPSFANLKTQPEAAVEHWFLVTRRVTLVTFPLLVWLGFNAYDFVHLILGPQWAPAVLPLRFLCLMTAIKIVTNVVAQMLGAMGFPGIVFRFDILTAIVLPLSFVIGCKYWGLTGMVLAWCTVFPVVRIAFMFGAKSVLNFRWAAFGGNLKIPILVALVCAVAMLPAAFLPGGWWQFVGRGVLWIAGLAGCFALPEVRSLARAALGK